MGRIFLICQRMTNDHIHDQPEPAARTLQLFRAGPFLCGIFADEIATVAKWRDPTPLPHAPKSVLGIVSLQGRMLTVLDLASLLISDAASGDPTSSQIALSETPFDANGHLIALRGDEQIALAIGEVGETIEIDGDLDEKPETVGTLVMGVWQREGLDIQVLSPQELFPTAIQGRERRRRRF